MTILDQVAQLQERIAAALAKSGRTADSLTLVAATKTQGYEAIREAIAAGISVCGENRVQELCEKVALNAYQGADLHFIGHLQSNKVRKVVGTASLIQSVDSLAKLRAIHLVAQELHIVQDVLVQINIGQEARKSGICAADLPALLASAGDFPNVAVRGLMAIPPIAEDSDASRRLFAQMYEIYVDIKRKRHHNSNINILSMGMSDDFSEAILEGATMVRVGSGIFGMRE